MHELMDIDNKRIEDMIYEIRGKQVMLDSDLACLFGYEVKQMNRQVARNTNRFPENYCFQLTKEEYDYLRCQNGTLKQNRGEHRKYLPYVFTEHGITMLVGILKSEIAVAMSLRIVDAFVAMRKYIGNNLLEQKYINNQVMKNTEDIKLLQEALSKLEEKKSVNYHIFFEGQIYDAYSLLVDILKEANTEITIIDNYVDKTILDIISFLEIPVTIITSNYNKLDMHKYKEQYDNVEILHSKGFHDRFLILDNKILYHCGASFKDLGKKCFAITKIEDEDVLISLLKKI